MLPCGNIIQEIHKMKMRKRKEEKKQVENRIFQ
jgi:hypothetical protein